MKFVADENIDRPIVQALRDAGHDALYVAEVLSGISDGEVLDEANQQEAILLTSDKDFGDLVFRHRRTTSGLVLLRLAGLSNDEKSLLVCEVIADHPAELARNFTVVTPTSVRIRHIDR